MYLYYGYLEHDCLIIPNQTINFLLNNVTARDGRHAEFLLAHLICSLFDVQFQGALQLNEKLLFIEKSKTTMPSFMYRKRLFSFEVEHVGGEITGFR